MASCTKCGKVVGCGCNLKGGLCATCIEKARHPVKIPPPTDDKK